MAKGFTLDARPCLYGEKRLSDRQVLALRELQAGAASIRHDATFYALIDRRLITPGAPTSGGVYAELNSSGRTILAAIDRAAASSPTTGD